MNRYLLAIVLLIVCSATLAVAQTKPTTRPRYVLTPPPGFVLVEESGRRVLCDPVDQSWVAQAAKTVAPATRPTTMPADLLTRLAEGRGKLVADMARDGALTDPAPFNKELDERLVPELTRLRDLRPPIFFLVTTEGRLKGMLRDNQWSTPTIHYNRLTDSFTRVEPPTLSTDHEMDDMLFLSFYSENDPRAQRIADLQATIQKQNRDLQEAISAQAMFTTQLTLANAFSNVVFDKLKLPSEQQWFSIGISGVLSADYAAQVTGAGRMELVLLMAIQMRNNPITNRSIDLLHPPEPSTIKRQFLIPYADAYRHKSMYVANVILEKARAKLPAMITSLREKPCTSGDELVKRIREVMDEDVSGLVGPR
jgi:hypothetical protein